jgi:F0F1-type ATP synthase membrane subunit b/b'
MEALIPDLRILVPQLALFFIAYFLLSTILFKPYLELLAARDARSFGASDELTTLKAEAEALQAEVEAALVGARDDAAAAREARLGEARSEAAKIVADAQQQAKQTIDAAYAATEAERGALRTQVVGEIDPLVADLANRLTHPGRAA